MEVAGDLAVQQIGDRGEQQDENGKKQPLQIVPVIEVVEQERHGDSEKAKKIGESKNIVQWKLFHCESPFCV